MNACPNCGRDLPAATAVCECGELLRAEVTHVHTWETETVFGKTSLARTRKNYAGVVAVVIGLTIFGFAWIGVRQNLNAAKTEQTATRSNTQVQLPTDSDILSADDELNA